MGLWKEFLQNSTLEAAELFISKFETMYYKIDKIFNNLNLQENIDQFQTIKKYFNPVTSNIREFSYILLSLSGNCEVFNFSLSEEDPYYYNLEQSEQAVRTALLKCEKL